MSHAESWIRPTPSVIAHTLGLKHVSGDAMLRPNSANGGVGAVGRPSSRGRLASPPNMPSNSPTRVDEETGSEIETLRWMPYNRAGIVADRES